MITRLICILLLIAATNTFGQARFEKGYFIDNNNRRTECFIKDNDRKDNPVRFHYKLETEASSWEEVGIADVKEFGIYGKCRFIRKTVQIDRTSNNINRITKDKNPRFEQQQLFLQVLVDGQASLYYYTDAGLERYFYSVSDTSATQLIYKLYLLNNSIAYNTAFRQQLWTQVRCEDTNLAEVEKLNYTSKDLQKYFIGYNQCLGDTTLQVDNPSKASLFNLKLTPGITLSSMHFNHLDFNNHISFRIGMESEWILPYKRNKWALLFEPSLQYFYAQNNWNSVKFGSLEIPVGLRHYFNGNNGVKVYINGLILPSFALDFNQQINDHKTKTENNQGFSYALGGGIEKDRWSIELRHYTKRKVFFDYENMYCEYERTGVIVGYKLIQSKNQKHNR